MQDPVGKSTVQTLHGFGIRSVRDVHVSSLYLVSLAGSIPDSRQLARRIATELLSDRVSQEFSIRGEGQKVDDPPEGVAIEVFPRPGVMDPVAQSTLAAIRAMGIACDNVRTGRRYVLSPIPGDTEKARIPPLLANECIEEAVWGAREIVPPPTPPKYEFRLRTVPITECSDEALESLSRRGHLFLSLDEMRAVQAYYRAQGREPTDLELETIAQTWSEHCVHKTLKSAFEYHGAAMPPASVELSVLTAARAEARGSLKSSTNDEPVIRYDNLLKDTIARATDELMRAGRGPTCLSVFQDNAGVIAFDDRHGIAFKVETHNHPSAIEPYGGAATGVGGVIRDVLGCGLGARPLANTDVFCVAPPDWPVDGVPGGVIHPRSVLRGVVAGVRDYGNRMGIPTVNGAVQVDPRYLGNPLVYCGCLGLIPRDRIDKRVRPGDRIVLLGGRTGRDGIHGATFSSAEMSHTHEDEFAHAVQIGNAIEEKKVLDVVLAARDWVGLDGARTCLFSAITDCGAGGLSSAIGEMAAETGAVVRLERVPLKYAGLRYDEIWISEAQERMVLAAPADRVETLLALCRSEDVEATIIGEFTDTGRLVVTYDGAPVGDVDLAFLHEGLPRKTLRAEWTPEQDSTSEQPGAPSRRVAIRRLQTPSSESDASSRIDRLLSALGNPTTASKHWIIRQYDHEVQGRSAVKPLVGRYDGPSDGAVLRPLLDSYRGVALGCGLAPELADVDPYLMAWAAIDEALRNVVCVGGDPSQTAILDNFCWPRVDDARNLGALVRACQACHDAALAYGVPFISGKDSLNNEFSLRFEDARKLEALMAQRWPGVPVSKLTEGRLAIPYTLLISAVSIVPDVRRCVTASLKPHTAPTSLVVCTTTAEDWHAARFQPLVALHRAVADVIGSGGVLAAHDVSDGGLAVAVAEMAMANGIGCDIDGDALAALGDPFAPRPGTYVLQVASVDAMQALSRVDGLIVRIVARVPATRDAASAPRGELRWLNASGAVIESATLDDLRNAWRKPLDW
ncbi:MAG: phosphoribosylformylglycinamidine synthase subunit PurL [Phycisphaerae bacterium]|nr:MAG: phosphoribosylformylglycinamidine synthase [Planctomycetia bacterium]GJQ26451.1 MAG: phosphoribosylformylglycinamidine synthase subunit PurL [Phycisphaerae bacterium]